MANLTDFLKSSVLTISDTLNAKTSGALQQTESGIQAIETFFTDIFSSLLKNITDPLSNLALTIQEDNTVAADQTIVSTIVNPIEVPITIAEYTYARAPSNTVTTIATTQPNDVSHTPIGIEPPVSQPGVYPYVKTFKTESGNIWEVDDTPGKERLFIYHKSGTYQEIVANGRSVFKVTGDNFNVVVQDDHIYVEGSRNLYVKGNMTITCLNDVHLNVGGRVEMNVNEDFRVKAKSISLETTSGDINMYSANNLYARSNANTSMYAVKNINFAASANVSIDSKSNFVVASTIKSSVKSDGIVAFDALTVQTNMNMSGNTSNSNSVIIAKKTGLGSAPTRENTTVPSIVESVIQGLDDDPDLAIQAVDDAVNAGRITKEEAEKIKTAPASVGDADTTNAANITATGVTKGIENLPESSISGELQLSENYRLSSLTSPGPIFKYQIRSQGGRSKQRIAANLALLSQNVLEPIRKKWGPITINLAFREGTGKSQHDRGMAVDITYGSRSTDPEKMVEIAKWIRDNIAFDQLILEYGTSQIWTHVSFDGENSSQRKDIRTCPNPTAAKYPKGLQQLAWTKG